MNIILPKEKIPYKPPLIYLAGPVQGAPNWRAEAIKYLSQHMTGLTIVTPVMPSEKELEAFVMEDSIGRFCSQRKWEDHYLEEAGHNGCVLFWLPGPKEGYTGPYGCMTHEGIGLFLGEYKHDHNLNFCIGSDGTFPGFENTIEIISDYAPREVYHTLEETCNQAMWYAMTRPPENFLLR